LTATDPCILSRGIQPVNDITNVRASVNPLAPDDPEPEHGGMNQTERRKLDLSIDAIMSDVDRLIAGHTTVGQWTLGAICDHLAKSINLSLDSPPADAPPTREQNVIRRLFFRAAAFPEDKGFAHPAQKPDPDADLGTASEALRDALGRLVAHDGPFAAHPVLGPMTRDEWLRFHARHGSHHLSFAVPT
jgi:hypothetical protein